MFFQKKKTSDPSKASSSIAPNDPNHIGTSLHIPRYPHSLLQHVKSQTLQPCSPYAATNQGDHDNIFTAFDPTLQNKNAIQLKYENLPEKGKWISILKVEPGTAFSELKCSLIPISLEQKHPEYEALSYTWGSYYEDATVQQNASKELMLV